MSPFQKETAELIAILEEANSKIELVTNPEIHWLKTKIQMDLNRHLTALKMNLGEEFEGVAKPKRQPLRKLFGKEIVVKKPVKDVNKPFHQSSFDVEAKELKLKAEELYPKFLITDSDQLVDSVSDIEIRGVAKKAGLPVTETNPAKITTVFVDQIKEAIRKQIAPNEKAPAEGKEGAEGPDDKITGNEGPVNDGNGAGFEDLNALNQQTLNLKTPDQIALEEMRKAVDKLYTDFNSIDNKDIIDTYGDIEIRGVAKKAGLPVTETNPAKIDSKFLNQIKSAIKKQIEIANIGK